MGLTLRGLRSELILGGGVQERSKSFLALCGGVADLGRRRLARAEYGLAPFAFGGGTLPEGGSGGPPR